MFDIFGIKAKRRVAELEGIVAELDERLIKYAGIAGRDAARLRSQDAQMKAVRGMAEKMRDRVYSHGMVDSEKDFLGICMNIHRNGKMISAMRFHHMLEVIKKEREKSSVNWQQNDEKAI